MLRYKLFNLFSNTFGMILSHISSHIKFHIKSFFPIFSKGNQIFQTNTINFCKFQLGWSTSSFSHSVHGRVIRNLIRIIQKVVGILFLLLLLQVFKELLIFRNELQYLTKILINESIKRVSKSYNFNIKSVIRTKIEFRI